MIQSMTGYGCAEKGEFRVEVRSLNHRFMDINIKMPSDLLKYEIALQNILKDRFARGKFYVIVSLIQDKGIKMISNLDRARYLYEALKELKEGLSLGGEIGLDTMLNFKEILLREDFSYNINSLYEAFNMALDELQAMRETEGRTLRNDLESSVNALIDMNNRLSSISSELLSGMRDRMADRIKSLIGDVKLNEERLLQEIAIMVDKADIKEEIARINSHLGQIKRLLSEGGTIGRRLDFILQELFREINTISSKSSDYRLSSTVVDMKVEVERIREQSQNIQ